MKSKTLFYCHVCNENKFGELHQQSTTYPNGIIRILICSCCGTTSTETYNYPSVSNLVGKTG